MAPQWGEHHGCKGIAIIDFVRHEPVSWAKTDSLLSVDVSHINFACMIDPNNNNGKWKDSRIAVERSAFRVLPCPPDEVHKTLITNVMSSYEAKKII